jgi:ketosteroid isomerase-like protein
MKRAFVGLLSCGALVCCTSAAGAEELRLASPVKKSIARNETHDYTVTAQADQRLSLAVEQRGIDLVVKVFGPDGKKLAEVDGPTGATGTETVIAFTPQAGTYRVSLVPFDDPGNKAGDYEIRLAELRPMTARETANLGAEKEIARLEKEWDDAVVARDGPALAKFMTDDFAYFGDTATGARAKEQHVQSFEQAGKTMRERGITAKDDITEHVIRVFGDTAVASGRVVISFQAKDGGSKFPGQFVHVWQKRDGEWRMVADHFYPYGRLPLTSTKPAVDPKVLGAYAGSYRIENGARVNVTPAAGGLLLEWVNPFGQFKQEFSAASDTTFVASDGSEVTFVRSPSGDVRELIGLSNGPGIRAQKMPPH